MIRVADVEQVEQAALDLLAAARNARTRAIMTRVLPDDERDLLESVHLALSILNELADLDRQGQPDILSGLTEIALFLGRGRSAVKRLIENEGLPAEVVGKKYLTTKTALLEWQTARCSSRHGVQTDQRKK